jgi:hypothetical protein
VSARWFVSKPFRRVIPAACRCGIRIGLSRELTTCAGRPPHDQTVELVADLDLAGEPRIGFHVEAEIQHVLLHRRRRADDLGPGFVDIDVAGGAGAGPAAFRLDARNAALDCILHHRGAVFGIHDAAFAAMVDKGDLGHLGLGTSALPRGAAGRPTGECAI